jgi:SAM-dependent methyltransferase
MLKLLHREQELDGVEMHGCDVSDIAIDTVRRTIPGVYALPCDAMPPSRYAEGLFGLVFAFSVFSHLREDAHLAWAAEFARMLRPGGYAVITVQGESYLRMCDEYRSGARPIEHLWHQKLANAFHDADTLERYKHGDFLFSDSRPDGLDESYGEAVVPRTYIESYWGRLGFEIVNWDETHGQNWCVLRLQSQ